MTIAARVDAALRAAGVAVTSVSVGSVADRTTWKVEPTNLQGLAQPILDAYVEPTAQELADADADRDVDQKALTAIARALWEQLPVATRPTWVQLRARIVQIYKGS